jgi:hypothetical protein
MAITSAVCSSFKQELLQGKHDFDSSGGHTFKIALFTSSATLGASTTDYSTSDAVVVIAFGGDKTATNGTFTIQFPTADASSAILRLA